MNHRSLAVSLGMHIWTDIPELSLIEALQKWLNLHFGLEQSCTNKFCKKWQLRFIMQHTWQTAVDIKYTHMY